VPPVTSSPWRDLLRWALLITLLSSMLVVGGGTAVWWVERDHPGANIRRWGDAVWWSMTTLTTVGYGEHYPVTTAGRFFAVVVMLGGIAIIGAVAALVAFAFSRSLAARVEAAVGQVEAGVLQVESGVELVEAELGGSRHGGLRDVQVPLPDPAAHAPVAWLLTRLGWTRVDPLAGSRSRWRHGATFLTMVPDSAAADGVGRSLSFSVGPIEDLDALVVDSLERGFHVVSPSTGSGAVLRVGGLEIRLEQS
jgi:hypothetical protein